MNNIIDPTVEETETTHLLVRFAASKRYISIYDAYLDRVSQFLPIDSIAYSLGRTEKNCRIDRDFNDMQRQVIGDTIVAGIAEKIKAAQHGLDSEVIELAKYQAGLKLLDEGIAPPTPTHNMYRHHIQYLNRDDLDKMSTWVPESDQARLDSLTKDIERYIDRYKGSIKTYQKAIAQHHREAKQGVVWLRVTNKVIRTVEQI